MNTVYKRKEDGTLVPVQTRRIYLFIAHHSCGVKRIEARTRKECIEKARGSGTVGTIYKITRTGAWV